MSTKNKRVRGISLAFGASFALAFSFIFSKLALNELNMIQFGFYWFAFGTFWTIVYILFTSGLRSLFSITAKSFRTVLIVAVIEALASALFYLAIQAMENPAIVAFIGSSGPVFVTLIGILYLKEKYHKSELAGIGLTLAGVLLISYAGNKLSGFIIPGAEFILAASLLFALATIYARKNQAEVHPPLLAFFRAIILFVVFALLFYLRDESFKVSSTSLVYMAFGAILEGVLTMIFAYQALKHIEAARTSLIISSKSIFALFIAWAIWGIIPAGYQLWGALLSIAGLYLLSYKKSS